MEKYKTQAPQIRVERYPSAPDWTLSEFKILGNLKGVGVEDEFREVKVPGETRIDNGIYEIELIESPNFSHSFYMDENGYLNQTKTERFNKPHLLIHVKNVKNFTSILWHWGNTDKDSRGCYIVGSSFATFNERRGVAGSKIKYIEIYPIIFQLIRKNQAEGLGTFVEYTDKNMAA